jgi:hypothetical protein
MSFIEINFLFAELGRAGSVKRPRNMRNRGRKKLNARRNEKRKLKL